MKNVNPSRLRPFYMLLISCWAGIPVFAQKNLELVSRVEYDTRSSNVWHYTSPEGTDYVLMGLRSGVSVVSLADPTNPVEVKFIPAETSNWRELRAWGNFAYVVTDQSGTKEGLLVIDLSGVPNEVTWHNWRPVLPGQTDTLNTCHTLWIDEWGYVYLSGCNVNNGGVVFADVFSLPGSPQFVGYNSPVYAHDCYAQNNLLYTADIFQGQFSVYDVTDKTNVKLLATQQTPFRFTHNVWTTADGKTIFTTDERANAPTASYDISDLGNIRQLDEFRPAATLNTGVAPHNAHVFGDFVVISHYTDGCIIIDATRPDNLVEVANYDTSPDFINGFHGAWGADPYLQSGLIAVSDIENGLYILKPTYQRACYLEGKITDVKTGVPVFGAKVEIQSPDANFKTSNATGEYKTGQVTPGTFEVQFRAKGYFDATATATLVNGEVAILNVEMTPFPSYTIGGRVLEKQTGKPIAGAQVFIENQDFSYTTESDEMGKFELPAVLSGDYTVYVGAWGYDNLNEIKPFNANSELVYQLAPAYEDPFNVDLGWKIEGHAKKGIWERGIPRGLNAANIQWRPEGDSPNDPGNRAYVTGNQGNTIFDDQVDEGETILISPPMELRRRYNRPQLTFDYWFFNSPSNNAANDSLIVRLSNGKTSIVLAVYATDLSNVQSWTPADTFDLAALIEITDDMRISFTASDRLETPNVVEAGVDHFRVWEGLTDDRFAVRDELAKLRLYPNPFNTSFTLDYKIEKTYDKASLVIFNPLGQKVQELKLSGSLGRLEVMTDFAQGVYFVALLVDGKMSDAARIVKGYR